MHAAYAQSKFYSCLFAVVCILQRIVNDTRVIALSPRFLLHFIPKDLYFSVHQLSDLKVTLPVCFQYTKSFIN